MNVCFVILYRLLISFNFILCILYNPTAQNTIFFPKTIEYPRCVTLIVLNGEKCNTQRGRSIERSPAYWMKEPIAKVSASLQLPLEFSVSTETVGVLRHALGLCMRTGWSSLNNMLFLMLFEENKQHLWDSCCQISLVISNMKFNLKLGEQFWRIWCFPIQRDKSCTCMPERCFEDGRRVTWLALKGFFIPGL